MARVAHASIRRRCRRTTAAGGSVRGQAFSASYNHDTRNWRWRGYVDALSPTFRADSGFIPQVEKRSYRPVVERIFVGSAGQWFNEIGGGPGCDRTTDWDHERASWGCDFQINYSGPMQLGLFYNAAPNSDYYRGETHNNFRHQFGVDIRPSGMFSLYLNVDDRRRGRFCQRAQGDQVRLVCGGPTTCSDGSKAASTTRSSRSTSRADGCLPLA